MVTVSRTGHEFRPDPSRVVAQPFIPGLSMFGAAPHRTEGIARRILDLDPDDAKALLEETRLLFTDRHRRLEEVWLASFEQVAGTSEAIAQATGDLRLLLGATFTHEYAIEAAALCNPSMVPAAPAGDDGVLPVILSLRAIGEGHISSIEFRDGSVSATGEVTIEPPTPYCRLGRRSSPEYDRAIFVAKLEELGADPSMVSSVFEQLPANHDLGQLEVAVSRYENGRTASEPMHQTRHLIHWLASSNYRLTFDDGPISERVISPAGPADSRGMEDARMVRFVDDDGSVTYYATYTAFDGQRVLPQLIETDDFLGFRIATLNGTYAQNKGMALFPRRIDGQYLALSRYDQESLFLMRSDHRRFWHRAEPVYAPTQPWEAVQIGNCGSPLETEAGWLVITHGVAPMRRYVLGAILLDAADPSRVVGSLRRPLLEPDADEREGYVPNVVYSCGGLIHAGRLVFPYGAADQRVRIMTADLDELLGEMT
ncbi:MAG: glycoside hydrolase family 130 protein [Actinomycetota bacterium]|nr:glycoside hydrolase family 130 protein [Actinomycetota bacterium]